MQIPALSIVFMGISALLAIGAPIALIVVFRKRFRIQTIPVVAGAAVFAVFVLILEAFVHQIVLRPDAAGNIALMQSPVLYMLYGGFMAGLFEETGRFVCFKLLKKRYSGVKTALGYGIGHGGIESIILVGASLIISIISCLMINSVGTEHMIAAAGASSALAEAQIATLITTPPLQFLAGGFERLFAIAVQISLSVFVYYAAYDKRRLYLFPAAILLHAALDFVPALYQAGALGQGGWALIFLEALVCVYAAVLVYLALRLHRRLNNE